MKRKRRPKASEHEALQKLQQEFAMFPWVLEAVRQYEDQVTGEAKFVKSVDKLLPLLYDYIEEGLFYQENRITVEAWQQQLAAHRKKAQTHAGAFEYYDELWNLLLANPHFFHTKKNI